MGHRRRQACPRGGLVDRSRLGWRLGLSLTHTRDASAGCGTWCKGGALMGPSRPPAGFCQGLLASFRPGAPWRLCLCHYVGFSSSRYVNPASRIDFTSTHPVSSLVQDLDGLLAPPAIIQKIQKDPYDSKGYTHTHTASFLRILEPNVNGSGHMQSSFNESFEEAFQTTNHGLGRPPNTNAWSRWTSKQKRSFRKLFKAL